MTPTERAAFLSHSLTARYARAVREARDIIANAVATDGQWCVAFSTGKDSTVVLDLACQLIPDIPVFWLDDGWDYPESIQFLEETERGLGRRIGRIWVPVSDPFWRRVGYSGDDPTRDHPSDMPFEEWTSSYNCLVGVRSQESAARRMTVRRYGTFYYSTPWKHWQAFPLAHWRHDDVWAYIAANDIAYNPVYDKQAELGVPLAERRVGPLTTAATLKDRNTSWIRRGWPELYNRFIQAFPHIQME